MSEYDLYCERLGPGLLAEPVNALTNLAFFVAAWFAWRAARSAGRLSGRTGVLIALLVAIGTGSALFHTFATGWARALDEVPILLFQLLFIWAYAREVMRAPRRWAAACLLLYLGAALYARGFGHLFNGSLVYAPAMAVTAVLGLYHWRSRMPARWSLLGAAALLLVAVALRTLDDPLCGALPLGTHFMWHLLVAGVAYLCVRTLVAQPREPG
jgi:hypothetical protein